jgi:hypothetical protein
MMDFMQAGVPALPLNHNSELLYAAQGQCTNDLICHWLDPQQRENWIGNSFEIPSPSVIRSNKSDSIGVYPKDSSARCEAVMLNELLRMAASGGYCDTAGLR